MLPKNVWNTHLSTKNRFNKVSHANFMYKESILPPKFSPSTWGWIFCNDLYLWAFIVKEPEENWNLVQ